MREIKFRAWDPDERKMSNIFTFGDIHAGGQYFSPEGCFSLEADYNDTQSIIMQYTGLKDKNGKEIYEGDIVRTDTGGTTYNGKETKKTFRYWEIKWDKDGDLIDGSYAPEEWMYGYKFPHPSYEGKSMEIIGNIYENPELLKEE